MRHVGKIKNNDKGNYFLNYGKSVSHYHHKHLKVEKEGSQMTHLEPCEAGAHDAMLDSSWPNTSIFLICLGNFSASSSSVQ